jgi:alpha-L-rhamnosidase
VVDLRCETEREPLGVATASPRFGWRVETDEPGWYQTRYCVQVAARDDFSSCVWDSGWVDSGESQFVRYDGEALQPRTRYYVRVSVSGPSRRESGWSAASWFETAKLDEPWSASFITLDRAGRAAASGAGGDEIGAADLETDCSRPIYLARRFRLDGRPVRGRVYATALGVYELVVNGARVGDARLAPGWTAYDARILYQTYDVTALLQDGENVIAAIVGPGWYAGQLTWYGTSKLYGDETALLAELRVVGEDGREVVVGTDAEGWSVGHGPILYSELYHGETYDAREERDGWGRPGFDERDMSRAVRVEDALTSRLAAQDGPTVSPRERLPVREVITTPAGETVLDFGANITGCVRFGVRGRRGDRVQLSHAEVLDADGNFYTENLRTARARISYTLSGSGDIEYYEPHFTFHGFRYARVDAYPGEVDPQLFEAVVLHSGFRPTLEFETSNDALNQLHRNIVRGWKGNALDVPTDCPQRDERLGWTGDAQVFASTAAYLMDVRRFFADWLRDLANDQRSDGGVPFVVPDVLSRATPEESALPSTHSATGWGDAAVVIPWTMYRRYGDVRILEDQYPSMRAWVEYMRREADDECLWRSGFHFGDWLALDGDPESPFGATPNALVATAYYAHSVGLLAQAAAVLGRSDDHRLYGELRRRIVSAFAEEFVDEAGALKARTQTAHVLALAFDLVESSHRERLVEELVTLIDEHDGHLVTGFLGTPLVCRVLAEHGRADEAYRLLVREEYPSWLYEVNMGATTVWEHWDSMRADGSMWSAEMNSFNHYAYGAVGAWMYAAIGGIDLEKSDIPNRRFVVAPRPGGGITHCRAVYDSLYGPLRVGWSLRDSGVRVELVVPPNTTAELIAPPGAGSGRGSPAAASEIVGAGHWVRTFP